jgi:16S rRNA (guanine966-N2)-methyltransferase
VDAIRLNLRTTGFTDRARVVQADAGAYLQGSMDRYDVALADPPYAFDRWAELLSAMPAPLVVIESDREVALPAGWDVLRSRRYGGTVVLFARRAAH